MSTVYISGPMTGLPEFNRPAFMHAEEALTLLGLTVLNPARIDGDDSWTWEQWMRAALAMQLQADGVYMLPGWQSSRGATVEHDLARSIGQTVTYERVVA